MVPIVVVAAVFAAAVASTSASAASPPPAGAVACSGCHATAAGVNPSVPRLVGLDASGIVKAMQEFRSGQRQATVMDRIAKGFTDAEIQSIAAWYAAQP